MAKAKDIRIDQMVTVNPVTDNQKRAFQEYKNKTFSLRRAWYW